MVGIYRIISPTGKVYIGESRNIERRLDKDYKYHNCVNQRKLYASIKKYGWDAHTRIVLQEMPIDMDNQELKRIEEVFIEIYKDAGYEMMNVKKKGSNWSGVHTETAIERIRIGNTGKIVSEETRERLSEIHKGKVLSEETKKKISEAKTGTTQPREAVERRRISCTGKKRSPEFCNALSERKKGQKLSEEHIKKLVDSHKGKPNPRKGKPGKKLGKQKQTKCKYCSFIGGAYSY